MNRRWTSLGLALSIGCAAVTPAEMFAAAKVETRDQQDAKPTFASAERAQTAMLGGEERYQSFVSTDKPIYHGGDVVYIRGVILNAANHKPMHGKQMSAYVQIKGPKGELLNSNTAASQDSVWGYSWTVPPEQAGGEYTAYITYPDFEIPSAERKFDIRTFRAPRLSSQIKFERDGYGPNDRVTAKLDVKRAEGGPPQGATVTAIARVDGAEIKGSATDVDSNGQSIVTFDLPPSVRMPRGEGTLSLTIEDGGVVETAAKSIPILMQTVDLQMFPEGGDLIVGLKNRVYFQANQPNGKPADLAGNLVWKKGAQTGVVTNFRTEHEGRGRFEFIPDADKEYFLTVAQPSGIKTKFSLPDAKFKGAVISAISDVYRKNEPVEVLVGSTDSKVRVTLSKKEIGVANDVILSSKHSKVDGGLQKVSFSVPPRVDGVLVVTVWDENDIPLAERLIFREPAKSLKVSITPDTTTYAPGDKPKLTIKTVDEDNEPVSAVVGLTVTDHSVLELVEKREQAPRLPVMVYLEPEVKDLADASVYLDNSNAKASMMTDLLLGTQGWRRFAFVDVDKFLADNGDAAKRAVAFNAKQASKYPTSILYRGKRVAFNQTFNGHAIGTIAGKSPDFSNGNKAGQRKNNTIEKAEFQEDLNRRLLSPAQQPRPAQLLNPIGRVEGPRNINLFQVEPTVIDERHYTSGRSERHQKTSPTLPEGSPLPDSGDGSAYGVLVREFTHQNPHVEKNGFRRDDFSETLYWAAGLKTDAKTGEALVNLNLSDSVTTFDAIADAFTDSGAVSTTTKAIQSIRPLYADVKFPLEVTATDKILLPVNVTVGPEVKESEVQLGVTLDGSSKLPSIVKVNSNAATNGRLRWLQPIDVEAANTVKNLTVMASNGKYTDQTMRKLSIKPLGYPTELAFGGVLEPGKTAVHTIDVVGTIAPKSMSTHVTAYPSPVANMTAALRRLIQDPYGCFEQTSSTSYPLTMAQQYFTTHAALDPALVTEIKKKLEAGYNRLVGFWCPDRGYEWFGQNPGHEALTAYGLLHFNDMAKVTAVDQKMVAITRDWLLNRRDGKGGFTNRAYGHGWAQDQDSTNAYIVWALLESGQSPETLTKEIASLKSVAASSKNNYVVALAANALFLAGEKSEANTLMQRLASKQQKDGSVDGITASIVGSGGESLAIEGTSLSVLAWLRDPAYSLNAEKSIKFLADSCRDGRYGSTQATVLALRAIIAYDAHHAHPKKSGRIREFVDGKPVGDFVAFDKSSEGAIELPDISAALTPGQHKIELQMEGGSVMPYSFAANYNVMTPISDKLCQVDITCKMAQDKVIEGNATEANVTITNKTSDAIPSPVAIVGLPGGVEVRHDHLKELKKKGVIDHYEVRGREVVLYWRALGKNAKVDIPLSVVAAIPGTYTGPASRAYLYYSDEHKQWADGLKIEIAAK